MRNDMKLIMESWRSNILSEQDFTQGIATPEEEQSGTGVKKVSDILALFDTQTEAVMRKRHSLMAAVVDALLEIASNGMGVADSVGVDVEGLQNIFDACQEIGEALKEIYTNTKDGIEEDSPNGFWGKIGSFAGNLFKQSALNFPFAAITGLLTDKEAMKVLFPIAKQLGVAQGLNSLKDAIPFGNTLAQVVTMAQSFGRMAQDDSDFNQALQARNPESAFALMIKAATTVDDNKQDMMGPLKVLDIKDEYFAALDKKITAEFMNDFVKYLRANSDKSLKDGFANDALKTFTKNATGVQIST
tara:strand:- start:453 stop:1358 length:906 start_codon:yes stop_codon:yes gene_type:complete